DVPAETVTRLLTGAGITRFTIVRDPFARFISAVADKLNVAKAQPPRKALLAHLGLPAEYSFHTEEVAEIFLGDAAAHHLDKHWRPQRACIAYGLMPYTAIGRAENWEHDFAAISARIFGTPAPQVDTRERYGHRTPPAYHRAADTPRLRRLVADLYAEDYEMLAEISESGLLPA
ncbi:MAG: sulfotransferase family 2 domain-containing protein, partial [Pseudomonadota bacterium]